MTWLARIYVALVDVFWFPVTFPLSIVVGYSMAKALQAHRRGDVLERRALARRGLSALHHPAMRTATAARWRAMRSASRVFSAYRDRQDYRTLLCTLEDLSR